MELGTLDQALRAVLVFRLDESDEEAVLEHAEPAFDGRRRYTRIAREVVKVDDTAGTKRAESKENLELSPLVDSQQLSDVALDIRLRIAREIEVASIRIRDTQSLGKEVPRIDSK